MSSWAVWPRANPSDRSRWRWSSRSQRTPSAETCAPLQRRVDVGVSTAARCRCRRRRRRWRARMEEARDRKQALARRAVSVVKPGQFVFLDSGSTNLALVSCLPEDFELTIATNSVDIAAAALRRSDLRLIMVGGAVSYGVGGCVDAPATLSLTQMNI